MASKPWTPFAKGLEAACKLLMEGMPVMPFPTLADADVWIAGRKFIEIISADLEARSLIRALTADRLRDYRQVMSDGGIRWELQLRCQCAHSFCMGRVEKRCDFDWRQPPEDIYRILLIEFWRTTALRWAKKEFGIARYAEARVPEAGIHQMTKRLAPTNPSKN